jgi:hypothetical protein
MRHIRRIRIAAAVAALTAALRCPAPAVVPPEFNYQGMLREFGAPVTGVRTMTFRLYGVDAGGSPAWTSGPQVVAVTSGSFNVALNLAGVDLRQGPFWIETEVAGQIFAPRQKLLPQVVSLHARTAEGISVSSGGATVTVGVTVCLDVRPTSTTVYGDLRVTGQISGTLDPAAISTGSVTSDMIADGAVTDEKIASVSTAKLTGSIPGGMLEPHSITADRIADGAVISQKIANNAVTDQKIVSLSAGKLIGQIAGSNIMDGTVTDEKITGVSANKIIGQINTPRIADGAVTDEKIASVSTAKLTGSIPGGMIAPMSITSDQIAELAVTADKIHTINAGQVNSGYFQIGTYHFPGTVNYNGQVNMNASVDLGPLDGSVFRVQKRTEMLLPPAAMAFNQSFTASTDGYLYGYVTATTAGSYIAARALIRIGASFVPVAAATAVAGTVTDEQSFCIPIRRGTEFRGTIAASNGTTTSVLYWQPIGREQ